MKLITLVNLKKIATNKCTKISYFNNNKINGKQGQIKYRNRRYESVYYDKDFYNKPFTKASADYWCARLKNCKGVNYDKKKGTYTLGNGKIIYDAKYDLYNKINGKQGQIKYRNRRYESVYYDKDFYNKPFTKASADYWCARLKNCKGVNYDKKRNIYVR